MAQHTAELDTYAASILRGFASILRMRANDEPTGTYVLEGNEWKAVG
jgi:hypothetical protein